MFKHRSQALELLDGEVEAIDLVQNLKELHFINKWLGGYGVSINALKKLDLNNKTIVDIGSGGGDMLHAIYKYTENQNLQTKLYGIDIKNTCTEYAKNHLAEKLNFITDDYRNVIHYVSEIDILHACLFTHHLTEKEIILLLKFAKNQKGVLIINDLHRNVFAYYSIKWLSSLFSKSYLVKNDAPLSVLRGFKKKEWRNFLEKAGCTHYTLSWKWAFRHQIIVYG